MGWKDWFLVIFLSLAIGTGINTVFSRINHLETTVQQTEIYKTNTPIEAFRIVNHEYKDGFLYLEVDGIKSRDCGRPTQFYIKYKDKNGVFRRSDSLEFLNSLTNDLKTPQVLPVLPDWQRIGFWRIKPPFEGEFYIYIEHLCPVVPLNQAVDLQNTTQQQQAQEIISRTYGPYYLP